ncbi:SDR family NAD(P)-dependent oxidoreductase [Rhodococcus koreensis]|uniref:SDR family NAD(P)-dependent oxidoreductase n=1 Tax=Rhodococcus koreensis TaxID=99653 RepID=UPI00366FC020
MGMLANKAVVITGSGRGIGAAYARECAAYGAKVVVSDLDADVMTAVVDDITAAGGIAIGEQADVTSSEDCDRLIDRCVSEFGTIDGLVNNAGMYRVGRIDEQPEAEVRLLVEANVVGAFLCTAAAVRRMRTQGHGSIVNITSGAHTGLPLMGLYGATKGAVASATYGWSLELAPLGIRVNAASPNAVTRMTTVVQDYLIEHDLPLYKAEQPAPESNCPLVTFLLSDRSIGITGQVIRIENEQLAIMTHPAVLVPFPTHERWTAELVAEAFDIDLAARQQPVGVVGVENTVHDLASAMWAAEKA